MEVYQVTEVENISGDPYICAYDGNIIEFKSGEKKLLPKNVAEFIVEKSYQEFKRKRALAISAKPKATQVEPVGAAGIK